MIGLTDLFHPSPAPHNIYICIKETVILIPGCNFESKIFVNVYTVFFEGL